MKVRIFTDGACSDNPGPGGWAAVFNTEKKCYTISGNELHTTNNRMELRAVVEALKKILSKRKHKSKNQYDIFSDSAYVVNTINNDWLEKWKMNGWKTTKGRDVKNRELWEELNELIDVINRKGIKVTFHKVKGHSGNMFNELVDKIAREESLKAKESKVK